jgi:hypothetical protein
MQAKERRGESLSKEKQKAETSAPVVNQKPQYVMISV